MNIDPPAPPSSPLRRLLLAAALLAVSFGLFFQVRSTLANPEVLPPRDFLAFWVVGHLNAQGRNPYDPAEVFPLEKAIVPATAEPVMMWNPPWTLTFLMPFGLLPWRTAQLLWLLLQFGLVLFCADWIWHAWTGSASAKPPSEEHPTRMPVSRSQETQLRWIAWLVAILFTPTLFLIQMGQTSALVLVGIVGFLHFEKRGQGWLAGACLSLAALKPHLVLLFGLAAILYALRERRWPILLGGLAAGLVATVIPLLCNPQVMSQYWQLAVDRPTDRIVTPALGTALRYLAGEEKAWVQFVPLVLGLAWFIPWWWTHRQNWSWEKQTPLLLLVSLVVAPYGCWPFDLVILILPVVELAARVTRDGRAAVIAWAVAVFVVIDGAALSFNLAVEDYFWFVWMAPAMLLGYLVVRARLSQTSAMLVK